jgi:hypothetical protein
MKLAKVYSNVPGLDEALLVEDYAEMFDESVEEIITNIQRRRTLGLQHNGEWYVEAPPFFLDALARVNQQRLNSTRKEEKEERSREEDASKGTSNTGSAKDENYYGRVLNLKGRVSFEDIKRRYRELVAQYHPDKVSHLGPKLKTVAEDEVKEINEAFQFFRDHHKK